MKKLIIIVLGMVSAFSLLAQTPNASQANGDLDLISMHNGEANYYSNNGDYSVDKLGRISGAVVNFHDNGNLEEKGSLVMGKKEGMWTKFSTSGIKINEAFYSNGQKDGYWKVWDANGTLRVEMSYDKGNRIGVWKFYDESGKVQDSKVYN